MTYFDPLSSYTSDDYFARVVGNDLLIDFAIGRINVDTDTLGHWIVEKIKHYENSSSQDAWRDNITLLADDSWSGGNLDGDMHTSQSEYLSKNIDSNDKSDYQQKKIYLPEYPTENVPGGRRKPGATADMVSTINTTGTMFLNWIGHGNPRVWAHEELYERSLTTPLMVNMDKLFFVVAATCDFGRFDMPEVKCGSEVMLNSYVGGSIGALSATRTVLSGDNSALADNFYQILFSRDSQTGKYQRLGDVMYVLKQSNIGSNDEKFYLLGDPTMHLLIPDYIIKIDTINSTYVGDGITYVKLKALSKVTVSGEVINPSNSQHDSSFNGTLIFTMLDADINLDVQDPSDPLTFHKILNFGGALNRSSNVVSKGYFKTNFIIPKDISYSNDSGRIFAYAYTNDNLYAKGTSRKFTLGDIDTIQNIDTKGPDISIYMDSRDFKTGGYVRNNPLLIVDLYDDSGINATGLGIGHRIEAWIDDNPSSIDLTDKYTTSLTDSRYGTAEDQLFYLTPGIHTVKVRAWDIFNNFSIAESSFIVTDSTSGIVINNLLAYPNPSSTATTFYFEHNVSPPFTAEINIYNTLGQLVQNLFANINTAYSARIPWNLYDNTSAKINTGVYFYTLSLITINGFTKNASGIFVFHK
jgi:hypothetical protein